jgi:hypothetical protein
VEPAAAEAALWGGATWLCAQAQDAPTSSVLATAPGLCDKFIVFSNVVGIESNALGNRRPGDQPAGRAARTDETSATSVSRGKGGLSLYEVFLTDLTNWGPRMPSVRLGSNRAYAGEIRSDSHQKDFFFIPL